MLDYSLDLALGFLSSVCMGLHYHVILHALQCVVKGQIAAKFDQWYEISQALQYLDHKLYKNIRKFSCFT